MRRILAYATLALVLGACGFGPLLSDDGTKPVDLAPSDLIGVWIGSLGDVLEFTSDGLFYGDDLIYMFQGSDLGRDIDLTQGIAPASGRWRIGGPLAGSGPKSAVSLSIDVVANQPTAIGVDKFRARSTGAGTRLRYYIGDPDSNDIVEYRRCTENCPSIAPKRPSLGVPATAKPEQLVGVWRDQHGARLVLHPDGSFVADDLRFAYVTAAMLLPNGASDLRHPLPGTGTWSTDSAESEPAEPRTILALRITTAGGHSDLGVRGLTIYRDGKGLLLATFTSNPDVIEQLVYRKAAA